jgi:hypothetical protein
VIIGQFRPLASLNFPSLDRLTVGRILTLSPDAILRGAAFMPLQHAQSLQANRFVASPSNIEAA